mgnify:CR=1 FL=1
MTGLRQQAVLHAIALASWAAGVMLCILPAEASTEMERRFIWDEATTQISTARTPDDFLNAARTYQKLADAGVRNGPLFYNLGTALLKAGQYGDATEALLRSERYMGTNPEIRRNLLLASARGQKGRDVYLPWYRIPLFWHFELGGPVRAAVATMAFTHFWIALALRFLGSRRIARPLLGVALLGIVLFGSSTATTLYQETRAHRPVFANSETETAPATVTPP